MTIEKNIKTRKQWDKWDKIARSTENTRVKLCPNGCPTAVPLCPTVYFILNLSHCFIKNKIAFCFKQFVWDKVWYSGTGLWDTLKPLPVLTLHLLKGSCPTGHTEKQLPREFSGIFNTHLSPLKIVTWEM